MPCSSSRVRDAAASTNHVASRACDLADQASKVPKYHSTGLLSAASPLRPRGLLLLLLLSSLEIPEIIPSSTALIIASASTRHCISCDSVAIFVHVVQDGPCFSRAPPSLHPMWGDVSEEIAASRALWSVRDSRIVCCSSGLVDMGGIGSCMSKRGIVLSYNTFCPSERPACIHSACHLPIDSPLRHGRTPTRSSPPRSSGR